MAEIPFVVDLSSINGVNGFRIYGTTLYERAGSSVASAGDVNGDGLADIIVGAPGVPLSAYGSTDYAAYVVFGSGAEDSPRPSSIDSNYLDPEEGFRIVLSGSVEGGFAVSSAGDFNGDGFGDVMVSAPSFGVDDKGATFIVFGKAGDFTDVTLGTTTSSDWIRIDGAAAGDSSGKSVASLGDINGDGFGDVLIGSPYADANGRWSSGVSYVVYGNASGTNLDLANFDASQGFRIIGNFTAGYSVSAAGDVNGDGVTDLLIGAPENDVGGVYFSGSTYLVYGNNSGADVDLANLTPSQGVRIDGAVGSESGFSVASAGDINGDGLADLIIGAPDESPNGREQAGAAYVIFGRTGGLSNVNLTNLGPGDGFRIIGAAADDNTGYSVSSAGDFNGDGFADIIVGAPNADPDGRTNTGAAYVIFGKVSGFGDIDLASLSSTDVFRIAGPAGQVYFGLGNVAGYSVASASDVNGDGYSDLLVGVPGVYSPGTTYVIYGEPSSAVTKVGTGGADRLFGGDFNDTLSGGDGNDLLGGREGDDLLTGGGGGDSFVYARFGEQHDQVTDFQQGLDVIDVAAANIGSFATVQQLLSNDAQGNAIITTVFDGLTSTITLTGFSAEQLTAGDFEFAFDESYPPVGTDNADDLFGGGSSNTLRGKGGDDRLFGEQGRDTLEGGAGADLLDGGEDIDEVDYRTAHDGINASLASGGTAGDAAGDRYVSIENMAGSEFDDVLEGNNQANTILALSGNNVIRGLGGDDRLFGGNENDTFYGGAGADEMDGAGGFDYARYDDAPTGVTVGFGAGSGDAAGDRLLNIEGIVGSAFADNLGGGSGNNDLQGGAGDDVLMGRWGDDTLDGGDGSDSAVFSGTRGSYLVTFDAATQTYFVDDLREGSPDGTDHVRNIETFVFADGAVLAASALDGNPINTIIGDGGDNTLTGTTLANDIHGLSGNDALTGLAGEDTLDGGDGDDTLDGGTGVDTASYASAGLGVTVSLAVAGPQSTGGAGVDTLVSIENLAGSAFDDHLAGDAIANVLSGLEGNDRLDGGAGNDTLLGDDGDDILIGGAGADALDGGSGFDLVSYETSTTVVPILYLMPIDLSRSGGIGDAAGDTYANIEGVIGSNNNDVITGRIGVDDTLIGAGGNDILLGQGGKDTLVGGVGNDLLIAVSGNIRFEGGDGIDTVSYTHGTLDINSGITADLDNPSRNTGIAAGHTYDGIENLLGSVLNDSLVGNDRANVIMGGLGDDVLIGGAGADVLNGNLFFNADITNCYEGTPIGAGDSFDIASYGTAMSGVFVSLTSPANNTGDAAGDTFILIEGLAGSAFDDTLVGDQNHNTLAGGAGNDTLIGIGEGDDYNGGAGNDTVVLNGRRGDYTITYDAGSQTFSLDKFGLVGHVAGVETLQFSDGALSVASLIAGDNNDNSLTGTAGADDLSGAGGNDAVFGLGGDDRLAGDTGDDTLNGGSGNDTILGAEGNDTLLGGAGVNTLNGGAGRDAASYADATEAVRVDLRISGAQATGGGSTDTLVDIEDLVGSVFDDTLIGNGSANRLFGGAGNDVLIGFGGDSLDGGAGNDTASYANATLWDLTVDLAISGAQAGGTLISIENIIGSGGSDALKGGDGANRLMGGDGNDTLMGRGGDDTLDGGSGGDTASYAEAAGGVTVDLAISDLQSTGEGSDTLVSIENLTGSAFSDTLRGTSGDNILSGGAGDDTLFGLGGNDRLDGGDGIDTVSYGGAATGVNVNLNFSSQYTGAGSDMLVSVENLAGSAFADMLTGNAGANALSGGSGNDRLIGGLGHDMLTGGAGNDVFDFNAINETSVGAGVRDVIADFQPGLDHIDLTDIDANASRAGDQAFKFIGTQAFDGKAGQLRYQTFDQAGTANDMTIVSGDINGDRAADFEIQITGILKLPSGDFIL